MDERQKNILGALIQMAWADGKITPEETQMISSFADRLGISLVDRISELASGLSQRREEQEIELEKVLPDHASRLEAMQMLVSLSFADGSLDSGEMDYLGRLALRLGIQAHELEQMRQSASR